MVTMFWCCRRPAVSASRKKRSRASSSSSPSNSCGQRHRLDRHHAADLRVLAQVDHAHRALAQLLLDLVAAQHRLFDRAAVEQHRAAGMRAAAAQDDGLGQVLGAIELGLQVLVRSCCTRPCARTPPAALLNWRLRSKSSARLYRLSISASLSGTRRNRSKAMSSWPCPCSARPIMRLVSADSSSDFSLPRFGDQEALGGERERGR